MKIYFQQPQQLLSIFTDLEDENLKLIQECREEEGNLEKIRCSVQEVSIGITNKKYCKMFSKSFFKNDQSGKNKLFFHNRLTLKAPIVYLTKIYLQ